MWNICIVDYYLAIKKNKSGAGEMAQGLRVLTIHPEDPG